MNTSINDIEPGDYVKTGPGQYAEVASVYGVESDGRLAKPSEGGFGVITTDGQRVTMWQARAYLKRGEL